MAVCVPWPLESRAVWYGSLRPGRRSAGRCRGTSSPPMQLVVARERHRRRVSAGCRRSRSSRRPSRGRRRAEVALVGEATGARARRRCRGRRRRRPCRRRPCRRGRVQRVGADEVGAGVGQQLAQLVLLDGDDAGDREQRRRRWPARSARRRRRRCARLPELASGTSALIALTRSEHLLLLGDRRCSYVTARPGAGIGRGRFSSGAGRRSAPGPARHRCTRRRGRAAA